MSGDVVEVSSPGFSIRSSMVILLPKALVNVSAMDCRILMAGAFDSSFAIDQMVVVDTSASLAIAVNVIFFPALLDSSCNSLTRKSVHGESSVNRLA